MEKECRMGIKEVKSREKMKKMISDEVTLMFQNILNYAEVACPTKNTYMNFRSKVLRLGNDCIRNIHKKVDRYYDVTYLPQGEDVIEIKQ